jgi:phospho-N-acetylmuramoyl-pentapeptide-transferase
MPPRDPRAFPQPLPARRAAGKTFSVLNVFRYITFRAAYATITALLISFLLGPYIISRLRAWKFGQLIREEGPSTHRQKEGTPTMGGILILISILVPTLLWADLTNTNVLLMLFTTTALGLLGFLDDYLRVAKRMKKGLLGRYKLAGQVSVGLVVALAVLWLKPFGAIPTTATSVPFIKERLFDLGFLYVPFVALVVTASSNAVNLSDGLDGLAIGLIIPPAAAFGGLAYVSGNVNFAEYLNMPFLKGSGELSVYAGAFVGASLGFLWYNAHPAQVFMGDTGSLSLGGSLGVLAILIKRELLLVVVGGIFVLETLSVMIQVLSFRFRGKRVFRMAPIHHHFELIGWPENRVVVRFWILAILLALVTVSTVKLQ